MSESVKPQSLTVRRGVASGNDADAIINNLTRQIRQDNPAAVIFFASCAFDFNEIAARINDEFDCPTIGCTTAGEISSEDGYVRNTVAAVSIAGDRFKLHANLLRNVSAIDVPRVTDFGEALLAERNLGLTDEHAFGILLIDGLTQSEEQTVAGLTHAFGTIPIVGGSAGDDLAFNATAVAVNGEATTDAAAVAVVETAHPFELFRSQHFEPTDHRLVITAADPTRRRVIEINGMPAAQGYADAVGCCIDDLAPGVFSANPLMLKIGGRFYVRAIQRVEPDQSLTFFCAIDNGLVLRIGRGVGIVERLIERVARTVARRPDHRLMLGFDCILRRLELESGRLEGNAQSAIRNANFIGFSTYGEQINGVHVNQTLTGVSLWEAA